MKEIEKKLRKLQTQYTWEKQKTKKTKSGDGADDVYKLKWPYFQQLSFLEQFITAKSILLQLIKDYIVLFSQATVPSSELKYSQR